MRAPFVIYADLECLLEKMSTCHNNPKKSSTTKINIHRLVIHCLHTVYLIQQKISLIIIARGKNCMKNFCLDLKEHATKIINYEKKEMINKRRRESTLRLKSLLYMQKRI